MVIGRVPDLRAVKSRPNQGSKVPVYLGGPPQSGRLLTLRHASILGGRLRNPRWPLLLAEKFAA